MLFDCLVGAHITGNTGKLQKGGCQLFWKIIATPQEITFIKRRWCIRVTINHNSLFMCTCPMATHVHHVILFPAELPSRYCYYFPRVIEQVLEVAEAHERKRRVKLDQLKAQLTGLWCNETLLCYYRRQWFILWNPECKQFLHVQNHHLWNSRLSQQCCAILCCPLKSWQQQMSYWSLDNSMTSSFAL